MPRAGGARNGPKSGRAPTHQANRAPGEAPIDARHATLPRQTGRTRKTTNKHDETTTYALSRGRVAGRRDTCHRRPGRLRSQARRPRCPDRRRPRHPCRRAHRAPARRSRTRTPLLRARSRPGVGRQRARARRAFDGHAARRGVAAACKAAGLTGVNPRCRNVQTAGRYLHGTKKSPNGWFGLNPPQEESGGDMRRLPQRDNQ